MPLVNGKKGKPLAGQINKRSKHDGGLGRGMGVGAITSGFDPKSKGVGAKVKPPAAPGTPGAPGGPPPAAPAPASPWSALHAQRVSNAQGRVAAMEPVIKRQEQQLSSEFGYGYDAAGNIVDNLDNPFSRAMALKEAFANRQRAGTNSAASRGQLYTGAAQNTQNIAAKDNLRDVDATKRQFDAGWQALQEKRIGGQQQAADEIWQADHDKLYDDLNSTPEDPGVVDWSAMEKKYKNGRWDPKVNADGSRNYRGPDKKLYKIWPDGNKQLA